MVVHEDEPLRAGPQKVVFADIKRALAKILDGPLFVATPKKVALIEEVGGASASWTALAYCDSIVI